MKKLKLSKKGSAALRITLLVIAALIIGLNVYSLNAARLTGKPVPMPLGFGASVVLSGSMEPEISTGDLVFVVRRDSYEIGDVVVYQDGRISVAHRIVSLDGDKFITRGDANNTEDYPISRDQIKGEVVLIIPLIGHLVRVIQTPIGTVVILGLAIYLIERSFKAEKESDQAKLDMIRSEIEKLKNEQNKNS